MALQATFNEKEELEIKTKRKHSVDLSEIIKRCEEHRDDITKNWLLRQAAMRYNIPKSTVHDKIKALNRGEEVLMKPKLGRFTSTFSAEYKQVLVDHVKDLSNRRMPLMKNEFLKLAYV